MRPLSRNELRAVVVGRGRMRMAVGSFPPPADGTIAASSGAPPPAASSGEWSTGAKIGVALGAMTAVALVAVGIHHVATT